MESLRNTYENIVTSKLKGENISPTVAIDSIIYFYDHNKVEKLREDQEGDILLFEYGVYDWDGSGKKFELSFKRQLLDSDNDEYYQISLTIFYQADQFENVDSFNLWSSDKPTISDWHENVINTDGFQKAGKLKPISYEVLISHT